eukprot:gnl/TRDRNA2_/TRDRNA2_157014_c2_seq4.p1 gnl/TRDRNA2_/TRDRNA2_157014_c2~~gnl/TRDRNA2_/TRDRNA2_157014_c2_seq4.p1  ORF type:complete len:809 (+),score=124.86 gnl/TRDRNA2_/TRDRNA2_157014_c2_seq4:213-2429(+)
MPSWRDALLAGMGMGTEHDAATLMLTYANTSWSPLKLMKAQAALEVLAPGTLKPSLIERVLRLMGARIEGQAPLRPHSLDELQQERAPRLNVSTAVSGRGTISGKELAHYVLSRVKGDEDSVMTCVVLDLFPLPPKNHGHDQQNMEQDLDTAAAPQTGVPASHMNVMFSLVNPPLGPNDVYVEALSGQGQFIIQARLTTGAGSTVGIETSEPWNADALHARKRLETCTASKGDAGKGCPTALATLPGWNGKGIFQPEHMGGSMEFAVVEDSKMAVDWPGTTVVGALTHMWTRPAMWQFGTRGASVLPVGALMLVTSMWPGCRRGLLGTRAVSRFPEHMKGAGLRYPGITSAMSNIVAPKVDPSHPLFTSSDDTLPMIRDLLLRHLDGEQAPANATARWQSRVISHHEAEVILSSLGPPFLSPSQPLLADRMWAFFARSKGKMDHFGKDRESEANKTVSLGQLVPFLQSGLQGKMSTPFDCLATDLDILVEFHGRGEDYVTEIEPPKKAKEGIRSESLPEMKPKMVGELMQHALVAPRLKQGHLAVIGDCRAAALATLHFQGPERVLCFDAEASRLFGKAVKDLRSSYEGLLENRRLDAQVPAKWAQRSLWKGVSVVIVASRRLGNNPRLGNKFIQDDDRLAEQLRTLLSPKAFLVVSMLDDALAGLGSPVKTMDVHRAWRQQRADLNATVRFYDVAPSSPPRRLDVVYGEGATTEEDDRFYRALREAGALQEAGVEME